MSKLDEQIAAVSALAGLDPRLDDVLKTLRWLQVHREVVVQTHAILNHPPVAAVLEAFPGTEIVGVRMMQPGRNAELLKKDGEFLADPEFDTEQPVV